MELKRLNKAIAETGFCSRREADRLIEQGVVKLNGKKVVLGDKVAPGDTISVRGKVITEEKEKVYLIFNKPTGIECTTNTSIKGNIISYLNYPKRIFPIGRLDKASEGLIFLTNDGDIVNKILRARNKHEKEYIVKVNKAITDDFVHKMQKGVPILDTVTHQCKVEKIDHFSFRITLTQGLNRQIRRMCEFLDYRVVALKRVRIMNIHLGKLAKGKYRNFNAKEMRTINALLQNSSKTV